MIPGLDEMDQDVTMKDPEPSGSKQPRPKPTRSPATFSAGTSHPSLPSPHTVSQASPRGAPPEQLDYLNEEDINRLIVRQVTKHLTDLSIGWPKDLPPAAAAELSDQRQLMTTGAREMITRMEAMEKKVDAIENRVQKVESDVQVGIAENTSALRRLEALLLGQYQPQQLPPAHTQQQQLPAPPVAGEHSQRTSPLAAEPMLRLPSSRSSTSPFLFGGRVAPPNEDEFLRQMSKTVQIEEDPSSLASAAPAVSPSSGPGPADVLTGPQGREVSAVQQPSSSSAPAPIVSDAPPATTSQSPAPPAAQTSSTFFAPSRPAADVSPGPPVTTLPISPGGGEPTSMSSPHTSSPTQGLDNDNEKTDDQLEGPFSKLLAVLPASGHTWSAI